MASEAPNESARVGTRRVSRQAIGHEPALADAPEAREAVAFTTAWADEYRRELGRAVLSLDSLGHRSHVFHVSAL